MKQMIPEDEQEIAISLLWMHLRESESTCKKNDAVLKLQIKQTYDWLNKIGFTTLRPSWETK